MENPPINISTILIIVLKFWSSVQAIQILCSHWWLDTIKDNMHIPNRLILFPYQNTQNIAEVNPLYRPY